MALVYVRGSCTHSIPAGDFAYETSENRAFFLYGWISDLFAFDSAQENALLQDDGYRSRASYRVPQAAPNAPMKAPRPQHLSISLETVAPRRLMF